MPISLRLDSKLERELNRYARMVGRPKSDVVRKLIADFIEKESRVITPWELGKEMFGREGSGCGNLSIDRKSILKEKLRAKKNRH
jgi:RHH-type transcriptional regulator, rel operon repressor / antitoxin RelB